MTCLGRTGCLWRAVKKICGVWSCGAFRVDVISAVGGGWWLWRGW